MHAGLVDPGLSGSLLAALWFFHRYHLLAADTANSRVHQAAKWLTAARVAAATAIPLGCVLFFAVLATLTAGAAFTEARWPWLYESATAALLIVLVVVELIVFTYYRRLVGERRRAHSRAVKVFEHT